MEPGFFLDLADNTGDNFSYVILPGTTYSDIPLTNRPVTLVRSVVRGRDMDSEEVPMCTFNDEEFVFKNRHGTDLIGNIELEPLEPIRE